MKNLFHKNWKPISIIFLLCLPEILLRTIPSNYKKEIDLYSLLQNYSGINSRFAKRDPRRLWIKKPARFYIEAIKKFVPDTTYIWNEPTNLKWSHFYKFTFNTNSCGYRGKDFLKQKPEKTIRIVFMGNSETFGLWVSDHKTIQWYLDSILEVKFPGKKIEVINMGIPGLTSYGVKELLKKDALPLHPDIVIVFCGANDLELYLWSIEKLPKLRSIFEHIALFKLLEIEYTKHSKLKNFGNIKSPIPVSPIDFEKHIKEIVRLSQEYRFRLIFWTMSLPYPRYFLKPLYYYLSIFENIGRKNGITVVKTENAFLNFVEKPENLERLSLPEWAKEFEKANVITLLPPYYKLYGDWAHPNGTGNKIIAIELAKSIKLSPNSVFSGNR